MNVLGIVLTSFYLIACSIILDVKELNFRKSSQSFAPKATFQIKLADLDADGDLDAVCANMHDNFSQVLLNDGKGNFTDSGQPVLYKVLDHIFLLSFRKNAPEGIEPECGHVDQFTSPQVGPAYAVDMESVPWHAADLFKTPQPEVQVFLFTGDMPCNCAVLNDRFVSPVPSWVFRVCLFLDDQFLDSIAYPLEEHVKERVVELLF